MNIRNVLFFLLSMSGQSISHYCCLEFFLSFMTCFDLKFVVIISNLPLWDEIITIQYNSFYFALKLSVVATRKGLFGLKFPNFRHNVFRIVLSFTKWFMMWHKFTDFQIRCLELANKKMFSFILKKIHAYCLNNG